VFNKWAGGNVYVGEDVFICATKGLLLLHQARDGDYEVHLPVSPKTVQDLRTGEVVPFHDNVITLSGRKATTHLLRIERRDL
jgi:hypothetical protein